MRVLIAGDFVPRRRTAAQIEKGDYCCLDEVKPIIQAVDYAIVNFESPVVMREAKPIEKTGPSLRCTEKAMECVAQAGFNCVTLANNHFRDYGQVGVEDTLKVCKKYKVDYVGGGKDIEEAERILYKEIKGQRIAIINFCENEWSIASEKYGGSAPLNLVKNYYFIQEAKKNADFVLIIIHGGVELYNFPSPRMKETYRFFVDSGADAVVNHHQHCYSGYEVYKDKPVFYGLGNFCFDKVQAKEDKLREEGYMVEISFDKQIGFSLIPYSQCSESAPSVVLTHDTSSFEMKMQQLNEIIKDDALLKRNFEKHALSGFVTAKEILSPYSSSFFKRLYSKGFLPSFVTKKRLNKMLANIQCESHKDILLLGLKHRLKI